METDYFKVPHNKHLGKKPKYWQVFKYSKEKIWNDGIGRLVSCSIEEMCDQPIEGLLYDLNRGEETILALAKADNIQWVNNFAATQVIKYLYNKVEELKKG